MSDADKNSHMNPVINPIHWSTQEIISYGPDTIHDLAIHAAGTVHSYHLVLGRCLLAVQRTKLYELFGCSGAVHYGVQVLKLRAKQARTMRWVAEKLEALPLLSRAGELGQVGWSILREVVRKATPETEEYWLELCRRKNYGEIAKLVRHTPEGGIPGDLPAEGEKEPAITDLRLQLGITARTVVERGLQVYSLDQGRPVPLAEAVEALFAKLLQKEKSSQSELDALTKTQQEVRKDLLADEYRREPLLREARELAEAMGLANLADGEAMNDHMERDPSPEPIAPELAETTASGSPSDETAFAADTNGGVKTAECPARGMANQEPETTNASRSASTAEVSHHGRIPTVVTEKDEAERDDTDLWEQLLTAHVVACPDDNNVILLANDWRNRRLRFNEDARLPTPAQRRELIRREGYCCATPGCSNHLWLEVHHVVHYSRKGKTISSNLTAICGSCHRNVHRGHLRITGQAPDQLLFTDRHGNDLRRTHGMSVAGWLDYWLGWRGSAEDSHQHRWARSGPGSKSRSSPVDSDPHGPHFCQSREIC